MATEGARSDPTWIDFAKRHHSIPWLDEDPLYALSEAVIDAIKHHVPDFFTEEQEWFERDLALMTGDGFFLRRPIGQSTTALYKPGLSDAEFTKYFRPTPGKDDWREKRLNPNPAPFWFKKNLEMERSLEIARSLIPQRWTTWGYNEQEIAATRHQAQEEDNLIQRRGEAYIGWLILNQNFRKEARELQATYGRVIARWGRFPRKGFSLPVSYPFKAKRTPSDCNYVCWRFYRRWCIEGMLTWELPIPLDARIESGVEAAEEEGVTLVLPWYMLRGGQFDLQRVIHRIRFESAPDHLRDWVSKASDRDNDQTGEISYQRLYWLYRCYELVLFRRYRRTCEKRIEKLDRAVSSVINREEDWVKRLRQRLARELRDH